MNKITKGKSSKIKNYGKFFIYDGHYTSNMFQKLLIIISINIIIVNITSLFYEDNSKSFRPDKENTIFGKIYFIFHSPLLAQYTYSNDIPTF